MYNENKKGGRILFSDRLKSARNAVGYSQKKLAEKLFISQQAYAKYETGAATPNPETLLNIANILNVSVDYLLGNKKDDDGPPPSTGGVWIPVLGDVAAGVPIEAIEDILGWEEITLKMAETGEHFGLQIRGDSMTPQICDGDIVIVRRQSDADTGDIAVVLVNGDEATVKRIKKRPEGLMLIPNNPDYEPMLYNAKEIESLPVKIVGKVVELRRKL